MLDSWRRPRPPQESGTGCLLAVLSELESRAHAEVFVPSEGLGRKRRCSAAQRVHVAQRRVRPQRAAVEE